MGGRPVWLASASLRTTRGELVPSSRWVRQRGERERLEKLLRRTLDGVGDPGYERFFRMPITACYHRALSTAEEAALPAAWHEAMPVDMAGGGLEVFWTKGIGRIPSAEPCHDPQRQSLPGQYDPDIYLINDCGQCPPCRARAAIHA